MSTEDHGLPEVSDETLGRIEDRVFATISAEQAAPAPRRRFRVWQGLAVAAAAVVVAAVIVPAVLEGRGVMGTSAGSSTAEQLPGVEVGVTEQGAFDQGAATAPDGLVDMSGAEIAGEAVGEVGTLSTPREVIRTGSASLVVDDLERAAAQLTAVAEEHGGRIDQLSIGADRSFSPADDAGSSVWVPDDGGYVVLRVPAEELDAVVAALDEIGEVASTRLGTQDVTSEAVDLRGRIDAARASVERLTELLAQAGDVGDLVQVETALSERQAELESLERQLESLEGQVAMSALSVSLLTETPAVEPDPAGFGDGLSAGWNGLLATLNGIVIGLGFLLPWLVVAGIVGLAVWAVVRARRRRRARGGSTPE